MIIGPWVQRARAIGPDYPVQSGILNVKGLLLEHLDRSSLSEEGEKRHILERL